MDVQSWAISSKDPTRKQRQKESKPFYIYFVQFDSSASYRQTLTPLLALVSSAVDQEVITCDCEIIIWKLFVIVISDKNHFQQSKITKYLFQLLPSP